MIEQFLCNLPGKKSVDKKSRLFCDFPNCITPMKEIPAEIRVLYDALLVQKKIPEKSRFYYKKRDFGDVLK